LANGQAKRAVTLTLLARGGPRHVADLDMTAEERKARLQQQDGNGSDVLFFSTHTHGMEPLVTVSLTSGPSMDGSIESLHATRAGPNPSTVAALRCSASHPLQWPTVYSHTKEYSAWAHVCFSTREIKAGISPSKVCPNLTKTFLA
jgi:hypothetical protein